MNSKSPYQDRDSNDLYDGDRVDFLGQEYTIYYGEKYEFPWMMRPTGDSGEGLEDLRLDWMAAECVKLSN